MEYLTVGSVSAIIAAVITLLQFIFPNALVLILVSSLSDSHSAVTWSVVSRVLVSSNWPLFLKSDASTSKNVARRVNVIVWIRPIGLFLIAVAAIVTPIGLYETILLSNEADPTPFAYIKDTGSLGVGTFPRSDLGFSRICGSTDLAQCPGNTVEITTSEDDYDVRVPKSVAETYQSGLRNQMASLSSFFDIQWRQYMVSTKNNRHGQPWLQERYRALTTMVLDDKIELVEGLIVDTTSEGRGIGFRNHTIPTNTVYGAEWDEDILFLEPETVCVDTNMTLRFIIPPEDTPYSHYENTTSLIDRGGFVNMNRTGPYPKGWPLYPDSQTDPSLQARAYRAAWSFNLLNMYYLNVSEPDTNRSRISSELGKRFPLNISTTYFSDFNGLGLDFDYTKLVDPPFSVDPTDSLSNYTTRNRRYPNPWNITSGNYTYISKYCLGVSGSDYIAANQIQAACGLIYSVPWRVDGNTSFLAEPGSVWERGIYSCASTTKASVKSVHFRYNTTTKPELSSLQVISISDKVYPNETSMPLWGKEVPDPPLELRALNPVWGLISGDMDQLSSEEKRNLSTIRARSYYLPASDDAINGAFFFQDSGYDFMAGARAPAMAWSSAAAPDSSYIDYTGKNNLAMYSKWQGLSRNVSVAHNILNLVWTDFATNTLVGTRSWLTTDLLPPNLQGLQKRDEQASQTVNVPIYLYKRKIRYHWVFGIPALLAVLLAICTCTGALISFLSRRGSMARVRWYLWKLSAGRILTSFIYPLESSSIDLGKSDTKSWLEAVGSRPISLRAGLNAEAINERAGNYVQLSQLEPKDQSISVVER